MGAMGVEAATSAAVFHACLDEALLPELRRNRPDAVLIMDNLSAHKAPRTRALLDASGFSCRFLPTYSPDLNPIEPAWATVKARLRRVAAHAADALTRHSARRWPASPPRTRRGSSATAATAVPSDLQNALGPCPGNGSRIQSGGCGIGAPWREAPHETSFARSCAVQTNAHSHVAFSTPRRRT